MKINLTTGFAAKVSTLTVVLLLSSVTLVNQSCSKVKLPSEVTSIVNTLSPQIPSLMKQAVNTWTPQFGEQGGQIIDLLSQATGLTKGGKTQEISNMFSDLSKKQVEPFMQMWKQKGKLDQGTIDRSVKAVDDSLGKIKKAGKIK